MEKSFYSIKFANIQHEIKAIYLQKLKKRDANGYFNKIVVLLSLLTSQMFVILKKMLTSFF